MDSTTSSPDKGTAIVASLIFESPYSVAHSAEDPRSGPESVRPAPRCARPVAASSRAAGPVRGLWPARHHVPASSAPLQDRASRWIHSFRALLLIVDHDG